MLEDYRVLDLTDDKGFLCGRILGDLGADVIKIEKPGGDPARKRGPFYHDIQDPEKSLSWFAQNSNKRGITLDIETVEGQTILKRMVEKADFLIESFSPGYLDKLGLNYQALSRINRRIIVTSITPFGQTGPYSNYKAYDIVNLAEGGLLYITGEPDRAPLRVSVPQASLHAGADAAVGSLMALHYREKSGEGQHVDVSIQESLITVTGRAIPLWVWNGFKHGRDGVFRSGSSSTSKIRQLWRCKDGHVMFVMVPGPSGAKTNYALTDWMASRGMADDFIINIDWNNLTESQVTQDKRDHLEKLISDFFLAHTKDEIYLEATERGVGVCPVSDIKDLQDNPQLTARDFWVKVDHVELGETITYPGTSIIASEAPRRTRRRAPLIGEHNREIYEQELGLGKTEMDELKLSNII